MKWKKYPILESEETAPCQRYCAIGKGGMGHIAIFSRMTGF